MFCWWHAFLSVMTATQTALTDDHDLIPFTRNEIRRLLATAMSTLHSVRHALHWSTWRRRHQAHAHACHYKKQDQLNE